MRDGAPLRRYTTNVNEARGRVPAARHRHADATDGAGFVARALVTMQDAGGATRVLDDSVRVA